MYIKPSLTSDFAFLETYNNLRLENWNLFSVEIVFHNNSYRRSVLSKIHYLYVDEFCSIFLMVIFLNIHLDILKKLLRKCDFRIQMIDKYIWRESYYIKILFVKSTIFMVIIVRSRMINFLTQFSNFAKQVCSNCITWKS